jgi:hypothetical protein
MHKLSIMAAVFAIVLYAANTTQYAGASMVDLQINEGVQGDFKLMDIEEDDSIISVYMGLHNIGSIEYGARARIDIMSGSDILFTGWSGSIYVNPGQRKGFVIYGLVPDAPNLELRPRLYYGNEIEELAPVRLAAKGSAGVPGHAFRILNFRTYDGYFRFDVMSNRSLEDIVIMPGGLPGTWIYEQYKIESIDEGALKEVKIPYHTGFFRERPVTISIATEDGSYYQEQQFELKRQVGIMRYINQLADWLAGFFRL